jgi:hypothetical protein
MQNYHEYIYNCPHICLQYWIFKNAYVVHVTPNQWLYENLLNMWEDFDFAKSKIILFVNSKNNIWQFRDNMFISPIDLCSE